MGRIFLPKWVQILNGLPTDTITKLTKLNITYAHVWNVLKELEESGLVKTELRGRERKITLTALGKELQELTSDLEMLLTAHPKLITDARK